MNPHSNLAFFGGTMITAIMVLATFANAANADGCPRSKTVEATSIEAHHKADAKAEVKA